MGGKRIVKKPRLLTARVLLLSLLPAVALGHCKVLAHSVDAQPLFDKAGARPDGGVVNLESAEAVGTYITTAKGGRIWAHEPSMRRPG